MLKARENWQFWGGCVEYVLFFVILVWVAAHGAQPDAGLIGIVLC
jgi:hypothetical protein